jgi:hypothetical protein
VGWDIDVDLIAL